MLPSDIRILSLAVLGSVTIGGSACSGSPAGPGGDEFSLVTINGAALPGPYPGSDSFEITSGSLTLHPDGRAVRFTEIRCKSDLPPGTTCQVTSGGTTDEGSYSRAEGWVQFGEPRWEGDGRFSAEFGAHSIVVRYGSPPSDGYSPSYVFDYRR
jgi:hypothetical protein